MLVRFLLQGIQFAWDADKATANHEKHGVEFEQAAEAFFDPFLRVLDRGAESGALRHAVLGMTASWQLLFVVFVERGDVIRLILARAATAVERRHYEDQ